MYNEKFEDLQEINWESICDHFNGVTSSFLSKIFEQLMNSTKENVEGSSMSGNCFLSDLLKFKVQQT